MENEYQWIFHLTYILGWYGEKYKQLAQSRVWSVKRHIILNDSLLYVPM